MKRPTKEEYIQKRSELNGDKHALSEYYNCTLQCVYLWENYFVKGIENIEEEERQITLSEYINSYKSSLTKPYTSSRSIKLGNKDCIIICLADLHIGSVYMDVARFEEDMKLILGRDDVYCLIVGDVIDYSPATKHQEIAFEQVFAGPSQIKGMAEEYIKTIGHKILAMISGCHDNWEYKKTGEFFLEKLAKYTTTKAFSPNAMLLNITLGSINYNIFMSHKLQNHSSLNPSHGMFRKNREAVEFDVGIEAHKHTPSVAVQNIRGNDVTVINCGSYKGADMFGTSLGYIGNGTSIPGFYLSSKEKLIIPFIDWRHGLYLKEKQE